MRMLVLQNIMSLASILHLLKVDLSKRTISVRKIQFVSDYANHRFMIETGLRIIELNLFARSVIECDETDTVLNVTIPVDITHIP